nr:DUF2516 family protein [Actinopolyspora mortivallis]
MSRTRAGAFGLARPRILGDVLLAYVIVTALWIAGIVVGVYAFGHAAMQRADAFTAANKLSKPAWLGITGAGALVLILMRGGPMTIIWVAGLVAALVYIVDVRPKVLEVQKGSPW